MDPWIDHKLRSMRTEALRPLADWLAAEWGQEEIRLLDYGCGDGLLARLVPAGAIDGYDASSAARTAARNQRANGPTPGRVLEQRSEIPHRHYDGVVLSSVLQYLPDVEALGDLLTDVARWLRPSGALGAIATDVPGPERSRVRDGLDLARWAGGRFGVIRSTSALVRTVRHSPGSLLLMGHDDVLRAAGSAGLKATRLSENLSPLRGRSSYRFDQG